MLIKFKNFYFLLFFILIFNCFGYTNDSIFKLNIDLINSDNQKVLLSSLNGKISILSMIYTNCKTVCPVIITSMKNIKKNLTSKELNDINFVLITLDPDRDSVEVLRKFSVDKHLFDHWSLFRTSKINTLKLSHILGVKYKKDTLGDYVHSNLILIIDKFGVIRMYHHGLDKDYSKLLVLVRSLI